MITLPTQLANFMKGKDLAGLKPFALLYRNKWNAVTEQYELDTTPIDITALIAKPNTLSMTLDVNEVAQYNANNVTLTLEDTKNYFVEGTPNSYFPDGYQIYGSRVVLYYGLNTPINPYPTEVGYTTVGSPTITDGVASGFSTNDYLQTSNALSFSSNNIFIKIRFKTPSTVAGGTTNICYFGNILTNNNCIRLYRGPSQYGIYLVVFNWNLFVSRNLIEENAWHTIDFSYIDGISTCTLYDKNGTVLDSSSRSTLQIDINNIGYFGGKYNQSIDSIDLNETYIKVNGEYWFNGAHFFWQNNSTPLFTGVIKEPPTHKPDKYQVDVKLVSPLEMLKDIEAKDFSDKVIGETLTYVEEDDDGHKVYQTTGTGVGGFDAVYADGNKLFEGVDYEVSRTNGLGISALVTIINSDYYTATITADYYTWKTGLSVEQIVAGLVGLAGYNSGTEDIRNVVWNTGVRTPIYPNVLMSRGYVKSNVNYNFAGNSEFYNETFTGSVKYFSHSILPKNFIISFNTNHSDNYNAFGYYTLGTRDPNYQYAYAGLITGIAISFGRTANYNDVKARQWVNGTWGEETLISSRHDNNDAPVTIRVEGNVAYISGNYGSVTYTFDNSFDWGASDTYNESLYHPGHTTLYLKNFKFTALDDNKEYVGELTNKGVLVEYQNATEQTFSAINASFTEQDAQYSLFYRYYGNSAFSNWEQISLGSDIGVTSTIFQTALNITQGSPDILNLSLFYLGSTLTLQLVNLSGSTVLEALQDFALISGYEFGVDRQGVFFFRPRVASTTPTYTLDGNEVVQVDTVKKSLNDFFTKLTLTFAEVPLEFYANTGTRPTPIDKYGVINKDIDKPEIVNYDNPELAQAIGPQLLEIYSALPNIIQAVGKLNLALELGDIVNLKRNLNLIADPEGSDFDKYRRQQTYYRACKITGMNYNFAKRQITYTLRDVSNNNNYPPVDAYGFPYDLPIQLGKLKTE